MLSSDNFYNKLQNCSNSEEVEQFCIDNWFIPLSRKILEKNPKVKSVHICVAQYWDDEADDAVHVDFVVSDKLTSSFEYIVSNENTCVDKYGSNLGWEMQRVIFVELGISNYYLDNTDFFIKAFEKYCKENGSQVNSFLDNYSQYLIVYKDKVKKVAELRRIWE